MIARSLFASLQLVARLVARSLLGTAQVDTAIVGAT